MWAIIVLMVNTSSKVALHSVVTQSCCCQLAAKLANSFTELNILLQPKQIHEIKDFLITARRKDAKCKLK